MPTGILVLLWLTVLVGIALWGIQGTDEGAGDRSIIAACLLCAMALLGILLVWR